MHSTIVLAENVASVSLSLALLSDRKYPVTEITRIYLICSVPASPNQITEGEGGTLPLANENTPSDVN